MEFRTKINTGKSQATITYSDPVLFIGSCFTSSIGMQMDAGRMPVMINPSGTVYNPVSVINTLKTITSKRLFSSSDLYNHNGTWLSFSHYTDFSSEDKEEALDKINRKLQETADFISGAKFLFVTFGTARVFRLKETGEIVSNCHKLPADMFSRELLSVDEISRMWMSQLDFLQENFPQLKVVFTVSPVRHWK
ncbi:MAG: GSCFA domain-containing protein, partial [Methanosarcina sp.]